MTIKAIYSALHERLTHKNFNDIKVVDICSAASISRATFYAHFDDKYHLLRSHLEVIRRSILIDIKDYRSLEQSVNGYIAENSKAITNTIKYANNETIGILRDLMTSIVYQVTDKKRSPNPDPRHIVFVNFSVGGLMNTLTWLVDENFPPNMRLINPYLYKLLQNLVEWDHVQ